MSKTFRVRTCKICGWESHVFGSWSRIDRELSGKTYHELEIHFALNHSDMPIHEYSDIRIFKVLKGVAEK